MKSFFLCLSLLPLTVSAVSSVSLRVEPDSDQFFSTDYIRLSCGDGWTVNRTGQVQTCGGTSQSSSCVLYSAVPSDSGWYWCESGSGARGPQRPLSVTDSHLILESPGLPVEAGSDVTLRCRTRPGSGLNPVIHRNRILFQSSSEWTITNVSKQDEGLYSCYDLRSVRSAERELRVKDPPPTTTSPPTSTVTNTSSSVSSLSSTDSSEPNPTALPPYVVYTTVVALLVLVLVLVLVLLRRRRQTGAAGADPESVDVTYADVTVRRAAAAPAASRPEEDTVYSGVRTRPKGPEELTYGEITIQPKKKKKKKRQETNDPWADPDVVYSSVRTRNSAGT